MRIAVTACITYQFKHVVCTLRNQILRKTFFNAFARDKIKYAFFRTVTANWQWKSLKFQFFIFDSTYETLLCKKLRIAVAACITYKFKHVVCTLRNQILRKKLLNAFVMVKIEYAFSCTIAACWQSKLLKFQFFGF